MVHQDDFHETAPFVELEWFKDEMKSRVELKWSKPMWYGDTYSVLKCVRTRTTEGMWYLGNQKYIDAIIEETGLQNESKGVRTPIVDLRNKDEITKENELPPDQKTKFRRVTGLARYMRKFRGDTNFCVKELSHGLSAPTWSDWTRAKRYGRYLIATKDYGVWLPRAGGWDVMIGWGDSDWAADKVTRKSTTSGVLELGGCVLMDFARVQDLVSTSSGEAEWYGQTSVAFEAIHLREVAEFLFFQAIRLQLHTDSSVAKSIGSRSGVAKLKHLDVRSLWLQEQLKRKRLTIHKCGTLDNKADLGTKPLGPAAFERLREMNSIYPAKGVAGPVLGPVKAVGNVQADITSEQVKELIIQLAKLVC